MITATELKALRLQSKISIPELAARTGLPATYIEQIEAEEIIPLGSDLVRLEKALKHPFTGRDFFIQ